MIKMSPSTYYADPKIPRLEQEEIDADIRGKIEQVRVEFPRAGYRMLLPNLKKMALILARGNFVESFANLSCKSNQSASSSKQLTQIINLMCTRISFMK